MSEARFPQTCFFVEYEIKDFHEGRPIPRKNRAQAKQILEERAAKYQRIKAVFENHLLISCTDKQPKIQFDDQNRRVLCGYGSKAEFKKAFPSAEKFVRVGGLVKSQRKGAVNCYAFPSPQRCDAFEKKVLLKSQQLKKEREEFHKNMEDFYKNTSFPELPKTDISQCKTSEEVVSLFLSRFPGFGVGDTHADLSSVYFFINHAPLFKKLGVTTFFAEMYPEKVSHLVEKYFDPSSGVDSMPKKLQGYLQRIASDSFKTDDEPICNVYVELFKVLKTNGIQVKCLENRGLCEADDEDLEVQETNDIEESNNPYGAKWRIKPMNYFAQNVLKTFIAEHPEEKFIYFDGFVHNLTYGKCKAPSIPNMIGCPWIMILDSKEEEESILSGDFQRAQDILEARRPSFYVEKDQKIDPDALFVLKQR